jgi:hypothetical protein
MAVTQVGRLFYWGHYCLRSVPAIAVTPKHGNSAYNGMYFSGVGGPYLGKAKPGRKYTHMHVFPKTWRSRRYVVFKWGPLLDFEAHPKTWKVR